MSKMAIAAIPKNIPSFHRCCLVSSNSLYDISIIPPSAVSKNASTRNITAIICKGVILL